MNQILSVGENKNKGKVPQDLRKIVKVFCILILIFGLVILGKSLYNVAKDMGKIKYNNVKEVLPTVNIDRDGNNIIVKASHDKEISKIIYNWNEEEAKTIEGNGTNYLQTTIELPIGNNTFNIKVIDMLGKEVTYTKEYVTDINRPQVSFGIVGNNVRITAKDNEELSYITYKWDNEEEKRIDVSENSKAQIEKELEILKGQHTLTVVATNTKDLKTTKSQEIKGITKPAISVNQDGKYLIITTTDEEAVKQVDYVLNDQPYKIDFSSVKEKTIIRKEKLKVGENKISIKAYNFGGATEIFDGTYVYNP